jgi:tetratricopeptide (TPR) repeat protein
MKDKELLSKDSQKKDYIISDTASLLPKVESDPVTSLVGFGIEEDTQGRDPLPTKLEFEDDLKRAAALFEQNEYGDAEVIYRKILEKDNSQPVALNMLGLVAYVAGEHEQAIEFIQMAIVEEPQNVSAYSNLARIYTSVGENEKSIEVLNHSLLLNPEDPNSNYNMGLCLCELRRFTEAKSYAEKSLKLGPSIVMNHLLMGIVLHGLDRCGEAIDILDEAISMGHFMQTPEDFKQKIYNLKGWSQMLLGSYSQALKTFELGLAINPNNVIILSNLGLLFQYLGQFKSSISMIEKVIEINPNYAAAQKNLGTIYLSMGRIKEGLIAQEYRWKDPQFAHTYRDYTTSQWDGSEDLSRKTVLLWPEQGPGDVIIWASVIPKLEDMTGHCIIEVFPKLVTLFARSFPNVEIREAKSDSSLHSLDFDTHLPMGSLFLNFVEDLNIVCEAFLVPDAVRVAYWRQRLEELGPGPYIGISWKSPVMTLARSPNYTAIEDWAPVFKKNANFINLECGDSKNDLDHTRQNLGVKITNFGDLDLFDDLDEVAALSAALDIVISVSNAAATIAAGVGTETWLLSWKESPWNNILFSARGPKVINFERSVTDKWEPTFMEISKMITEREVQRKVS